MSRKKAVEYITDYIGKGITFYSATNLAIKQVEIEVQAFPEDYYLKDALTYLNNLTTDKRYLAMQKYERLLERIGNVSIYGELQLNSAETIIDVGQCINTLTAQLERQKILSDIWRHNYNKLLTIVRLLEDKTNNVN